MALLIGNPAACHLRPGQNTAASIRVNQKHPPKGILCQGQPWVIDFCTWVQVWKVCLPDQGGKASCIRWKLKPQQGECASLLIRLGKKARLLIFIHKPVQSCGLIKYFYMSESIQWKRGVELGGQSVTWHWCMQQSCVQSTYLLMYENNKAPFLWSGSWWNNMAFPSCEEC